MPYVYIGKDAIHFGKPLFKILNQLKNFGIGRLVYRNMEYIDYPDEIHYYRILAAQPLMKAGDGGVGSSIEFNDHRKQQVDGSKGKKSLFEGNVVAEKVFRNVRRLQPVNISEMATVPDFILIPRLQESRFVDSPKVKDYNVKEHGEKRPASVQMSPLMQLLVRRDCGNPGVVIGKECEMNVNLKLPTDKVYEEAGDEPDYLVDQSKMHSYKLHNNCTFPERLRERSQILPPLDWDFQRMTDVVGVQRHSGYIDVKGGWEVTNKRDEDENNIKHKR